METLRKEVDRILRIWVALNYSPQGDGNSLMGLSTFSCKPKSHLTIPRKGMETLLRWFRNCTQKPSHLTIPRKGMETCTLLHTLDYHWIVALNYSPQGDGNLKHPVDELGFFFQKSHLTIPRKGMETKPPAQWMQQP